MGGTELHALERMKLKVRLIEMSSHILRTEDLCKYYDQNATIIDRVLGSNDPPIQAVDGISIEIAENETLGVIGESGCGKSTLLRTIVGLEERTSGDILYRGENTGEFSRTDWKEYRSEVQIVFQDPYNSLNPRMTVRENLMEPLIVHGFDDKEERIQKSLEDVALRPAELYLDDYPDQLSGGELQRVSIARALVLEPEILLADEPASMLDLSTQAALLNLLSDLVQERGLSMIYISHDLSTVSYVCDRVSVMYLGRIVETTTPRRLISEPQHPYTNELINAIPLPDPFENRSRSNLEGATPDPVDLGEGCRFRERCPERMEICEKTPVYQEIESNHNVACHLHYDHEALAVDREPQVGENQ